MSSGASERSRAGRSRSPLAGDDHRAQARGQRLRPQSLPELRRTSRIRCSGRPAASATGRRPVEVELDRVAASASCRRSAPGGQSRMRSEGVGQARGEFVPRTARSSDGGPTRRSSSAWLRSSPATSTVSTTSRTVSTETSATIRLPRPPAAGSPAPPDSPPRACTSGCRPSSVRVAVHALDGRRVLAHDEPAHHLGVRRRRGCCTARSGTGCSRRAGWRSCLRRTGNRPGTRSPGVRLQSM